MNKMKKNAGTVALHPAHLLPVESRFRAGLLLQVLRSPAGMATHVRVGADLARHPTPEAIVGYR